MFGFFFFLCFVFKNIKNLFIRVYVTTYSSMGSEKKEIILELADRLILSDDFAFFSVIYGMCRGYR